MAEQNPRVLNDRYEIHRRLARGGMAQVYLARDRSLDRPVAVKELVPEFAADPSFVERFRREAQAAANLNHPNIVAVYDWGQQYGTYFIVMEYVEGRALSDIIRTEGPLHPHRAAEVAADVAAALAFAHRNGVVHRDVKPGNILITSSGQVKVADFGIAQAVTTGDDAVNLTQAGSVMGTATYFSPEQAQGHAVDPRSDVYSLGCVLYETLTTRPPFAGDTPVAIAYKHVQEPVVPPSRINPNVPDALDAIVMLCLAKQAADRYPSAEDLRSDLRAFLDGKPTRAMGALGAAAAGATVGAMAGGATAADATVAVPAATGGAGAGAGAAGAGGPGGGTPPYVPDDGSKPKRTGLYVAILVGVLAVAGLALFFVANRMEQPTKQVQVPDVVNLQVTDAVNKVQASGFKVETKNETSDRPVGTVFEQTPAGNTNAAEGSTVLLRVSGGVGQAPVPAVTGRTQAAAESLLRNAGFVANATTKDDPTVPVGQVISQSPAANAQADKGSVVDIVVSAGPTQVTIPDLTNATASSASNALGQLGLKVTTLEQPSTQVPSGSVISTNPAANAKVPQGATVTLNVSSGPPPTTAPPTTRPSTTTPSTASP